VPRGGARPLNADQTNTSVVLGEQVVAKLYRTLEPGPHPEVEAVAALDVDEVPAFRGALIYRDAAGEESALLFLQDYVAGAESGWDSYIERLVAVCAEPALLEGALADAAAFGAATARLHRALASALPVSSATPGGLASRRAEAERRLEEVQAELGVRVPASSLARLRADLAGLDEGAGAPVQRLHGDLTVAQFLRRTDGGLSVVDFEGEPGRPLAERAAAWTPAWDLATLLLSFENAGAAARRRLSSRGLPVEPLLDWLTAAPGQALEAYGASVPEPLLRASLAEKQLTELLYASRRLPEWLYAPLEVLHSRWG
jgi:maltokinase